MAKMVDEIAVPMARASILWLIGEYSERVPKIAPDVLRKMAKSFVDEVIITGCVLSFCVHSFSTVWYQDARCEKTLNSSCVITWKHLWKFLCKAVVGHWFVLVNICSKYMYIVYVYYVTLLWHTGGHSQTTDS